jgi:hypothetical protein
MEVVTGHPLHLALGSIAPRNGFGFGGAFVSHYTPNERWRLSWNADAVLSPSGAWRAGGYMKMIHTPVALPSVITDPSAVSSASEVTVHPYTVIDIYLQSISLRKLLFYGLGPMSSQTTKSAFGMRETITGASAIVPVTRAKGLNLSLLGEINGRFVALVDSADTSAPAITSVYAQNDAPGLASQPTFLQFGEGVRIKPSMFNQHLDFNYLFKLQEYVALGNSIYGFRRWTLDFDHEVPLFGRSQSPVTRDTNGPDECAVSPGTDKCPAISRNRGGTIGFRLLVSQSLTSAGHAVPFFFQPTIGGSDVDGASWLSSYGDYRFRGPNVLVMRESFEHSIYSVVGFTLSADQGKVAATRSGVNFEGLTHSVSAGVNLRAGGFPLVHVLYSWGSEGRHFLAIVSTTLLGGSRRPSLY